MEARELQRRVKRRELAPVLFLWGEESLLIDEAIQQLEAVALDPAVREFNRDVFYGDEAEAQAILNAAQTLPWLAGQRFVLVRRAEALPRAADAPLVAYCKRPCPNACVVFTAHHLEAGRPLFTTLAKLPWAVRCRRLLPRELAAWVEHRVAAGGCRILPEAVAVLIEATGNDLRMVASEIDKLVSFVGPGRTIDEAVLTAVTGDVRETSAFELARLLSTGALAEALRAWHKFSSSGEYPGLALGAMSHHVRQLWHIKLAQQRGATPERIASELHMPVFTARRLSAQAAGLAPERLRQWLEALFTADQQLKRSGLSAQTVFEGLILRCCLGTGSAQTLT